MISKLPQLVTERRLAAVHPGACAIALAWYVDHPQRSNPDAKRVQFLMGMSRATYYRHLRTLKTFILRHETTANHKAPMPAR